MIDYTAIGRQIVEEVINEPGICFYPAGFKPPHKGHFKAAKNLASRNYIAEVVVIISRKPEEGITPEESLQVWKMYLEAEPNPKIKLRIAQADSPIKDIFGYLGKHQNVSTVYVAGGDDEKDDQEYLKSIQDRYPNIVKTISIHEKDGRVNSYYVRELLRAHDYESFKTTIPEAAYNKGFAPKIFKMLTATIQPAEQQPEEKPTLKAPPAPPIPNEPEQA
jgi:hypothetical protein